MQFDIVRGREEHKHDCKLLFLEKKNIYFNVFDSLMLIGVFGDVYHIDVVRVDPKWPFEWDNVIWEQGCATNMI